MATTVARQRKVVTVLQWLSVMDFSSYGGGAIWGAHLGGLHDKEWRRRARTTAGPRA
jgi:hypothetical protein